jgi:hypothetical protein
MGNGSLLLFHYEEELFHVFIRIFLKEFTLRFVGHNQKTKW